MQCQCRTCGKRYEENKSRADYKGYCSQGCLHIKAKEFGWKKGQTHIKPGFKTSQPLTEYDVLKRHGQVGSIFVNK